MVGLVLVLVGSIGSSDFWLELYNETSNGQSKIDIIPVVIKVGLHTVVICIRKNI